MEQFKWWAYIHTNDTLQLKRYFSYRDIQEAQKSPFCTRIVGPFSANSREEAKDKVIKIYKAIYNNVEGSNEG